MKKVLLFFSLVAMAFNAYADNYVTIDDVRVRPGGRADVVLKYHFDSEKICAYQLDLQFPEGITMDVESAVSGPTTPSTFIVGNNDLGNGHYRYATFSFGNGTGNEPITDHEGVLLTFTIYADASLTNGSELDASAYELIFPENNGTQYDLPNIDFKIIIDENAGYVDLLETSTTAPEDANDVDVRVYRTIQPNEWSTICLPFDMTEDQVKGAFGEDVQLADFTGCEFVYTGDDLTTINANFSTANAIEANHPYLIKVSESISMFPVYRVNITVDDASVDCDRIGKGTSRDPYRYNSFIGTYVANTEIPDGALFIAGNNFWYSTGLTKMKAFRGYFDFYYLLSSLEDASTKVNICFDGTPTSIEDVNTENEVGNGEIFTISGVNVGKDASRLQRGVYIVNGKKVVKK